MYNIIYGKHGANSNLPYGGAMAPAAGVVQAGKENGQRIDSHRDSGALCPASYPSVLSRSARPGVRIVEGTQEIQFGDGSRGAPRKTSQYPLALTISWPFISWTRTFSLTSCAAAKRPAFSCFNTKRQRIRP